MAIDRAALLMAAVLAAGVFETPIGHTAATASPREADEPLRHCEQVADAGVIKFQGHTLTEIPDIQDSNLRRANVALSWGCFALSATLVDRFARDNPNDHRPLFLQSRYLWVHENVDQAHALAQKALREHPDFTSMKVLLASMAVGVGDVAEATQLLDEIQAAQPTDMWAYIDRLRIEAMTKPSKRTLATLRAILKDPRFPASARHQAAHTARYELPGVSQAVRDEIFEDELAVSSFVPDCLLANQAIELIEDRMDPVAGAKLLEKYMARDGTCHATPLARILLAEAYLLQAAKIAPQPTPQNAQLITWAKNAMANDLTPVALRIVDTPQLNPILPLISDSVDHRQVDELGNTVLCNAVIAFNPDSVRAELAQGADPNAKCGAGSAIVILGLMPIQGDAPARQKILRDLLQKGGKVDRRTYCRRGPDKSCEQAFLPIIDEFQRPPPTVRN
jgi:tetratricopeptide (TPR) repeat protein